MVRFAPVQRAEPFIREFYPEIKDDTDPSVEVVVAASSCCLWVECLLGGDLVGGFLLIPDGADFEVITLLRKPARGAAAVALAREAIAMVRAAYPDAEYSGHIFSDNRKAQVFATAVGLRRADPGTTIRNGVSLGTTRYLS